MSLLTRSNIEWLNQDGRKGYSINPWVGCAHNCTYCWSRDMRRMSREEWEKPVIKAEVAPDGLDWMVAAATTKLKGPSNILLSATTDFFQPYPAQRLVLGIQEAVLRGLSYARGGTQEACDRGFPSEDIQLWVLTKSNTFVAFLPLLERAKIGVTISSLGPIGPEVFAPSPILRHLALQEAKKAGCFTYISIEPWLPGITHPREIIEMSESYCDWWIVGSLNKMMRAVDPSFYRRELPPLQEWVRAQGLEKRVYIKRELRRLCENENYSEIS